MKMVPFCTGKSLNFFAEIQKFWEVSCLEPNTNCSWEEKGKSGENKQQPGSTKEGKLRKLKKFTAEMCPLQLSRRMSEEPNKQTI